ncbi:DUF4249 domain-containing protein [Catalinimonas sp. 4WD22]|uniref:DUF4249 domain-containing protein n=1 Tax=Catalinimonas locisalis TaxID=3133978 RepID=UPI003101AD3B
MLKKLIPYCTLLLAVSCTKELDLPYPQAEDQLVLNGILHPDSLIKVSVTKTLPVHSFGNDYPLVKDATVRMYEDDELLGELIFQDSLYVLDYYPKAGSEYRVEVAVEDYPEVRASDIIPDLPDATACIRPDTTYVWGNASIQVDIQDKAQESNFYWFYTVNTSYTIRQCEFIDRDFVCTEVDPPLVSVVKPNYYQSYSSVPDRFNAFVDNTSGGITEYEFYIRIDDVSLDGLPITFDVASYIYQPEPEPRWETYRDVHILSTSRHYDRYLKSSVIYALNQEYNDDDDIGFKPFVASSEVYSNIENGMGIFAAYNSVSIPIDEKPCK